MLSEAETTKFRDFVYRAHVLLGQQWMFRALPLTVEQCKSEVTEFPCGTDLLGLLAELIGHLQNVGEAFAVLAHEADELGLSRDDALRLVGIDLSKWAVAHTSLAEELSSAGNRALDLIGVANNGT